MKPRIFFTIIMLAVLSVTGIAQTAAQRYSNSDKKYYDAYWFRSKDTTYIQNYTKYALVGHSTELVFKNIATAEFTKTAEVAVTTDSTWTNLTWSANTSGVSTGLFALNSDSSGIIYSGQTGILNIKALINWESSQDSVFASKQYLRIKKNATVQSTLQSSQGYNFIAGAFFPQTVDGNISVTQYDTIKLEWYTTSALIDIASDTAVVASAPVAKINLTFITK